MQGTQHVAQSTHMPNAPTMPPGPADEAAIEHGRAIAAEGDDRSAAFWAIVRRVAGIVAHPLPERAPRRVVTP